MLLGTKRVLSFSQAVLVRGICACVGVHVCGVRQACSLWLAWRVFSASPRIPSDDACHMGQGCLQQLMQWRALFCSLCD